MANYSTEKRLRPNFRLSKLLWAVAVVPSSLGFVAAWGAIATYVETLLNDPLFPIRRWTARGFLNSDSTIGDVSYGCALYITTHMVEFVAMTIAIAIYALPRNSLFRIFSGVAVFMIPVFFVVTRFSAAGPMVAENQSILSFILAMIVFFLIAVGVYMTISRLRPLSPGGLIFHIRSIHRRVQWAYALWVAATLYISGFGLTVLRKILE